MKKIFSGQDGFDAQTFHKNCDNKGATIWIAKVQGSTQLIGGYNPLGWNGHIVWKKTPDSFLFNFTDGKNITTAKLGYVSNAYDAVYCDSKSGPFMGGYHSHDTVNWVCNDYYLNTYPNIGIPKNFKAESFEVFQVIKK
jgi:hypothetical protein